MTLTRRKCRVCGRAFDYLEEKFAGFRPPCLCLSCHVARRERLVLAEGLVVRIAETGAYVDGDAGGRFFWRYFGSHPRPRVGDRVSFRHDPEDAPSSSSGWRLPLVRHPHIIERSEATR